MLWLNDEAFLCALHKGHFLAFGDTWFQVTVRAAPGILKLGFAELLLPIGWYIDMLLQAWVVRAPRGGIFLKIAWNGLLQLKLLFLFCKSLGNYHGLVVVAVQWVVTQRSRFRVLRLFAPENNRSLGSILEQLLH